MNSGAFRGAVLAVLLLSACDSSRITKSAKIGGEGGTLSLSNGVTVVIPPGALESSVEIGAAWVKDPASLQLAPRPAGIDGPLDGALVLTPHGTQFKQPVQVTMPTSLATDDLALLRLADEKATEWSAAGPVKRAGAMLQFETYQFSVYSATALAAGSCPCWSASTFDRFDQVASPPLTTLYPVQSGRILVQDSSGNARLEMRVSSTAQVISCSTHNAGVPDTSVPTLTGAEVSSCDALISSRYAQHRTSNLEVAAYADNVPPGEFVGVWFDLTPPGAATVSKTQSLPSGGELAWVDGVYETGTQVAARVVHSPAGMNCTVQGGTGPLGTQNVAVHVVCTSIAGCVSVAASAPVAPALTLRPMAPSTPVIDPFDGTQLNTEIWRTPEPTNRSSSLSFNAGALVVSAQPDPDHPDSQSNWALEPVNRTLFTDSTLHATVKFTFASDTATTPNSQLAFQVFTIDTSGTPKLALKATVIRQDDTTANLDVTTTAGQVVYKSSPLDPAMTLEIQYDNTVNTNNATVTLTAGANTPTTATFTATTFPTWTFGVSWAGKNADPAATVPVIRLDEVDTNVAIAHPATWTLTRGPLALGGADYGGVAWVNTGSLRYVESVSTPTDVDFDGTAPAVYARLVTFLAGGHTFKETAYSPIVDDATFTTQFNAGVVASASTIDQKVVAFTQQPNGSYAFGIQGNPSTCP